MQKDIVSLKKAARLTGLFWLLGAAAVGFSLVYVRTKLIVWTDSSATANNIIASEYLFRSAIASNLLGQIFLLFFGITAYCLFKEFNKIWAMVLLTSILVSVAVAIINSLNNIGALVVLSDANYLQAFGREQLDALMMIFLRLNNYGIGLVELFSAIFLFSFGLLIIKSRYVPKILGVLLMIGACAFPVNTFTKILVPQFYPALITQLTMIFNSPAALTILWLLVKGIKEQ